MMDSICLTSCVDCGTCIWFKIKTKESMQKVSFNCTKMIENDLQIKLDMLKLIYMSLCVRKPTIWGFDQV